MVNRINLFLFLFHKYFYADNETRGRGGMVLFDIMKSIVNTMCESEHGHGMVQHNSSGKCLLWMTTSVTPLFSSDVSLKSWTFEKG